MYKERVYLEILECALEVSDYTNNVDVAVVEENPYDEVIAREEVVEPVHVSVVLVLAVLHHNPWTVRMLGHVIATNPELIVVFVVVVCEADSLISLMEKVIDCGRVVSPCLIICADCRRVECETCRPFPAWS